MGELKYISFEEESQEIKPRVLEYWTERADSFFTQRQHELSSTKAIKWKREIETKISEVYGDMKDLKILGQDIRLAFDGKLETAGEPIRLN